MEVEKSHQWPQILAVLTTLILVTSCGIHAGWPSPVTEKLEKNELGFNVSQEETSYVVSIHPLGYLASPITSFFLDRIGRKYSLLCLAFPQILACLLIAVATKIYTLYVARFVLGFVEGAVFSVLPLYIGEISEPVLRGRLGVSYTTAFSFGFFVINCYGSYMPVRTSAYVSACWPVIFLCTFIWMPETPYYFLMKGDTERARLSLQKLRRMNNVEHELVQLTTDVQRQISESTTLKEVFTVQSNIKSLFILIGLRTLQQCSGGGSVITYNQRIFQSADGDISHATSAIIFNGCLTIVTFMAMSMVDRYGRRPLLLISVSATIFCLLIVAIFFNLQFYDYDTSKLKWMPITGMVFYTIARGFGLSSIPTMMSGELFPANAKAKAMGLVTIYMALCLGGTMKIFHFLNAKFGMHVCFSVFVCCTSVGLIFVYYCVPETKGKTLEEIQQKLKGNID